MLDRYQRLLSELRADPSRWIEVAYREENDAEGLSLDTHAQARYGVLLALQYDRRGEDQPLIRHLLEQEVLAHRNAPLQGLGDSILLAAFLLARYRCVEDAWLLADAKLANTDTFGGFDLQFLFAAGVDTTIAFFRSSQGSKRDFILKLAEDRPLRQWEVDNWWKRKEAAFPETPEKEDLLRRAQQALHLDALEEGRRSLDAWETTQPPSKETWHTLMRYRDALRQPDSALAAAESLLQQAGSDRWARTVAQWDVVKHRLKSGQYEPALQMLRETAANLQRIRGWKQVGLGMMTVELALDVGLEAPEGDRLAGEALLLAHSLMRQGARTSLNVLRKAVKLSKRIGNAALHRRYWDLAVREHGRIRRQFPSSNLLDEADRPR